MGPVGRATDAGPGAAALGAPGPAPPGEPYAGAVETHTSVVLLVGDRAYKVKRAVRLPFLDLSTRERRVEVCQDELRLNRRYAPDVYLGVLELHDPLTGRPGEPVVVMKRMPLSRRLSALVAAGRTADAAACVDGVAHQVAAAHGREPAVTGFGLHRTTSALWREGHAQLQRFVGLLGDADVARGRALLDEVDALAAEYLRGRGPLLDRREAAGLVVDGHGDLLADDVFALDDGPRILDCLEFDRRLRVNDVLADVAFLAMDLETLGAPDLARRLVDGYRRLAGEHHPRSLEHHWVAYRAFVRSKVACLRSEQGAPGSAPRARSLLALARDRLRAARVHLVLLGGPPGSGKSTVAQALAAADADREWAWVGSDTVRKELAGVASGTSCAAPVDTGLYAPDRTQATYTEVLRRAATALDAGVCAVLDASWADAGARARAREVAAAHGAVLTELRCTAPREECLHRLDRRTALDAAGSDAVTGHYDTLAARADPWPQAVPLPTTGTVEEAVERLLALIAARPVPAAARWPGT